LRRAKYFTHGLKTRKPILTTIIYAIFFFNWADLERKNALSLSNFYTILSNIYCHD